MRTPACPNEQQLHESTSFSGGGGLGGKVPPPTVTKCGPGEVGTMWMR